MDETYEDMSFWEKAQYKLNQLKEEFLHLSVWQKVALLVAGSILCTILFYTFFIVNKLAQVKKTSKAHTEQTTTNPSAAQEDSGQKEDTKTQEEINKALQVDSTSTASAAENIIEASSGIVEFIENLLGVDNQTNTTSNTTGTTNTNMQSSQNVQSVQPTYAPQQYIVNFLNGLLYFQDPTTGIVTPYIISGVNPTDFTWGRYENSQDGYAIDYPTNWTLVKRSDSGHEGLSLYPPSEDPTSNDAKQIGLGWSARFLLPTAGGADIYYQTSITIDNTLGQLFTLGGGDQGGKGIALLLPHRFGYFGLGGSADTSDFIYVFQRMLSSLKLTK